MNSQVVSLSLSNSDVEFNYVPNNFSKSSLVLTNTSMTSVAYKLKATNPNAFLVKPCLGLLERGAHIQIELTLHPKVFDKGLDKFNEKILLLASPITSQNQNTPPEQIFRDQNARIEQQKLNVLIFGTDRSVLAQSKQRGNSALFESVRADNFASQIKPLGGSIVKSASPASASNSLDRVKQQLAAKEEAYNEVLKETQQYISQKAVLDHNKKKNSFVNKLLRTAVLVLIGYSLTIYRQTVLQSVGLNSPF